MYFQTHRKKNTFWQTDLGFFGRFGDSFRFYFVFTTMLHRRNNITCPQETDLYANA